MNATQGAFGALFSKLSLPVIVCGMDERLPVYFMNSAAKMALAAGGTVRLERTGGNRPGLNDILRFEDIGQYTAFAKALYDSGAATCAEATLRLGDEFVTARIHGGAGFVENRRYLFVYILPDPRPLPERSGAFLTGILDASHQINDADAAINAILAMAGKHADASRAYAFERVPSGYARETYEWCADGVEPGDNGANTLDGPEFFTEPPFQGTETIISKDLSNLPEHGRKILERHGVKALVILPIHLADQHVGYIGFDDCRSARSWTLEEIRTLQIAGSVVASLIHRRDAEREAKRNLEIVTTVTDNLDDLVYVTDIDTYELKFVSQSLGRALNRPVEQILGKHCWKVLHRDQSGPCSFCPISKLVERHAQGGEGVYVWELHNNLTGKWYMVKDSIVRWTDGAIAHLGTFIDITYRKQYEEQLKRFAATDAMTDVYNRKWGYGKLDELFRSPPEQRGDLTLCFIDIDGLKSVNDRLGHAAGDEMIVNTIRALFSCIRKEDFICRWGGDEFLLLLHCNQPDAVTVMNKILFALEHFNDTQDKPYAISISYGLIEFSNSFSSLDALIDEADRRMYANKMLKRSGSNIFPRGL